MRKILLLLAFMIISFFLTLPIHAAKPRIRKPITKGALLSYSTAKLSRNTNSVIVTLQNLHAAKRIRYELSYLANGIPQGAMGSIAINGQETDSRDLYFGTCSHGVCTPHYNITQATLVVTTDLVSGGTNTKRYKIKI